MATSRVLVFGFHSPSRGRICSAVRNTSTTHFLRLSSRAFSTTGCHQSREIYFNDKHDPSEPKFGKILIANRGEIACRVIASCKAMGIKSVAVHSDVDSVAKHVQMADEAVLLGPAMSSESYLRKEKILEACQQTGAEAVHPGYGFLSENTVFAKLLEDNGIVFVGPSSGPIKAMGDKIESKRIALKAKVNCIPGFDGVVKDAEDAIKIAQEIGYPVMIKASAGGGGKGMRIAWNDKEAAEGFRLSSQEAASSFGDDRLLVEKYVDNPRHIEVQILGDKHGNVVHLNERECSIQRRNQKVVEESPSPFVDPELREKMGSQAVQLARAVGYDSAGTVEFLVDSQKNFYFLEMNTRLQVEHPITECVTGVDIVHQMIRIARGNKLLHQQSDIPVKGSAVECRVYAEDPYKNFGMPSIGRLEKYEEPRGVGNVRCDSGIQEGSEISMYYDPLICKLTTWSDNRQETLDTMVRALDSYVIRGVTHNIPLLRDIMTEAKFREGDINTKYLYKTYPDGFTGKQLSSAEENRLVAISACMHILRDHQSHTFTNQTRVPGSPMKPPTEWSLDAILDGAPHVVQVRHVIDKLARVNKYVAEVGGETLELQVADLDLAQSIVHPKIGDTTYSVQLISRSGAGVLRIRFLGTAYNVQVMDSKSLELLKLMPPKKAVDMSKIVVAPMSGMVKSVSCAVGDLVVEGQEVAVVEAMKMQNSLSVQISGKVKKVNFSAGQTVTEDDVMVEIE